MIARRLRDKWARGEPISIENFIIDTIIIIIIIIIIVVVVIIIIINIITIFIIIIILSPRKFNACI